MAATAAASRIGPSVTNAATPRTMSRVIRMSPNIPARCSPRLSQTSTWPGGQASMALRWGIFRIGQNLRRAEVLAHGNGAQRVGLRRKAGVLRIERAGTLDEGVAQAALEQLHGDRGDAHGAQSLKGVVGQRLV